MRCCAIALPKRCCPFVLSKRSHSGAACMNSESKSEATVHGVKNGALAQLAEFCVCRLCHRLVCFPNSPKSVSVVVRLPMLLVVQAPICCSWPLPGVRDAFRSCPNPLEQSVWPVFWKVIWTKAADDVVGSAFPQTTAPCGWASGAYGLRSKPMCSHASLPTPCNARMSQLRGWMHLATAQSL